MRVRRRGGGRGAATPCIPRAEVICYDATKFSVPGCAAALKFASSGELFRVALAVLRRSGGGAASASVVARRPRRRWRGSGSGAAAVLVKLLAAKTFPANSLCLGIPGKDLPKIHHFPFFLLKISFNYANTYH